MTSRPVAWRSAWPTKDSQRTAGITLPLARRSVVCRGFVGATTLRSAERPGDAVRLPAARGRHVGYDDPVALYRNSPLFHELRDPTALKGKCGRCEFREVCGGSRARIRRDRRSSRRRPKLPLSADLTRDRLSRKVRPGTRRLSRPTEWQGNRRAGGGGVG